MALSARERGRYARHLLLPEIGLAGQEQLVSTRVRFAAGASREASMVAREYLERAGLVVEREEESGHGHEAGGRDQREVAVAVGSEQVVQELAGVPELVHAAAALTGALAAVEAVKTALRLGTPVEKPWEQLSLTEARTGAPERNSEDV